MSAPDPDREEALKAQKRRNLAIGLALGLFVILLFIVTIVRLGGGAIPHP